MHLSTLLLTSLPRLTVGLASFTHNNLVPPSQDQFYQPPSGYERSPPGTILKVRRSPTVSNIQLLYRTTTSRGDPLSAVTTVFIPANNPDPRKLLSVQEPEDSADVDCPPSYTVQQPGGDFSNDTVIQMALSSGWFVNLPDHEGALAAFGNGNQAGRAVLDSIRAVLASGDATGVQHDALVTLQGYSGGAIASEWATSLQPSYAPELEKIIAGAAMGGLVPTLSGLFQSVNEQSFASLIPNLMLGITAENASLRTLLYDKLNQAGPLNKSGFSLVERECFFASQPYYNGTDIYGYFSDGGAWLNSSAWRDFVDEVATMGLQGTPRVPIYSYHAVLDQITPVADTDRLMDKYCAQGARIEYVRNATADHLAENPDGLPNAFAWLVQRMEGVPVAKGCNVTTV